MKRKRVIAADRLERFEEDVLWELHRATLAKRAQQMFEAREGIPAWCYRFIENHEPPNLTLASYS